MIFRIVFLINRYGSLIDPGSVWSRGRVRISGLQIVVCLFIHLQNLLAVERVQRIHYGSEQFKVICLQTIHGLVKYLHICRLKFKHFSTPSL